MNNRRIMNKNVMKNKVLVYFIKVMKDLMRAIKIKNNKRVKKSKIRFSSTDVVYILIR